MKRKGSGVQRDERWVLVHEHGDGRVHGPVGMPVRVGAEVIVGREGDLSLGVEVEDRGISRRAVVVTAEPDGWSVDVRNTNRAVLYPWGQRPVMISGVHRLSWPRIAIHVLNGKPHGRADPCVHWLLLDADAISVTRNGAESKPLSSQTFQPEDPYPLTPEQEETVRELFAEHLEWPPRLDPRPAKISTVARRLTVSEAAVKDRIKRVQAKAQQLGLHRHCGTTDPEYLHTIVRAGLLAPPRGRTTVELKPRAD